LLVGLVLGYGSPHLGTVDNAGKALVPRGSLFDRLDLSPVHEGREASVVWHAPPGAGRPAG
jgi:hypothetical protein